MMVSLRFLSVAVLFAVHSIAFPTFGSDSSKDATFKSSVFESLYEPPIGWVRDDTAKVDKDSSTISLRIHLVQQNMDKFHDMAMKVVKHILILNGLMLMLVKIATPGHELYGSHLSQQVIDSMIAPREESSELVMEWLNSEGLSSHASLSRRLDSVIVEASVSQIEKLLNAEYSAYGMCSSLKFPRRFSYL